MDPTLLRKSTFTPLCAKNAGPRLALTMLSVAIITTVAGCQTGLTGLDSSERELPIPAAAIDPDQFETVRYQSRGSGSRNAPAAGGVLRKKRTDVQALAPWERMAPGADDEAIDQSNVVTDIVIRGNRQISSPQIVAEMKTRIGRYFDEDKLQRDVDRLWRLPEINRINGPYINRSNAGIVITLDIVERSAITSVKFVGNRGVSDRALRKQVGLEVGMPLNGQEVRMAKNRLEEFYKDKGFPRTQVELGDDEDNDPSTIVFIIHEDVRQRVWDVEFEGNEIASDARLKSFIESKPGIAKLIGGTVKREEIDQDVLRLTNYYRSLGFFNARIGREVSESDDGKWVTLRFIIDEGPRYRVRSVSFIGNNSYQSDQLLGLLELKPNGDELPEFVSSKMNADVVALQDLYGTEGFVMANVQAEPRFLEEPGLLDMVYRIEEGKQYRVGQINIHFEGDYGITKQEVVLNRLGLSPGDKIDSNVIRKAERTLGSSQIFAGRGTQGGQPPKIVVRPPELGGSQPKRR